MQGFTDPQKRHKLLDALRSGASVTDAAQAAGYSRQHIYKMVDTDPELAELLDARPKRRSDAPTFSGPTPAGADSDEAQELRALAIKTLQGVCRAKPAPAAAKVAAAKALLNVASQAPAAPPAETEPTKPETKLADLLKIVDGDAA